MLRGMVLLVCLFLVQSAGAQIQNPDESTPTTLYFHVFDVFNKFVINTQAMDADFFEVGGTNNPTLAMQGYDLNTIYGTSTAGPVEYDFIENGRPRFHPEKGIAADVLIDASVQPVAYLYLDVRDVLGLNALPNAMPDLTFRVTMREGDDAGRSADLDQGAIIMQGEVTAHLVDTWTAPTVIPNAAYEYVFCLLDCTDVPDGPLPEEGADANTALAGDPSGQNVFAPDADGLIEVAIPMDLATDRIPKSEAFNVRIDWYQGGELMGEDEFAEGYFRLVADPDHLPRLDMHITNPIYVEFIHPQVAAGTLLIHTGVNSPWGTYDVDVENIRLTVEGPSAPQNLNQVVAQNAHVHGLHDKAAEITYLWSFRDEGAAEGDYTITLEVPNHAGTAVATGVAGFTIEGKQAFGISDAGEIVEATGEASAESSPGVGAAAMVGCLVAVAFAGRRWKA